MNICMHYLYHKNSIRSGNDNNKAPAYQVLHHGEVTVGRRHVQRRRARLSVEAVLQVVGGRVLQVEQHLPLRLRPEKR